MRKLYFVKDKLTKRYFAKCLFSADVPDLIQINKFLTSTVQSSFYDYSKIFNFLEAGSRATRFRDIGNLCITIALASCYRFLHSV